MNLQPVIQAKRQHLGRLLRRQNVVACGVGFKESGGKVTDELCVVVSVTKKVPVAQLSRGDVVPKALGAVATDVREVGVIRALLSRTVPWRPAPGGVSIGHIDISAGTLGCLVTKDGELFILSNNHVLAACFDEQTEVLTKSGWQKWDMVSYDTLFATRSVAGLLKYQKATLLTKEKYCGQMIHFEGMWHDLLVTPNHRLFVKKTWGRQLPARMAELLAYQYHPVVATEAHNRCKTLSLGTIEMTNAFEWEGQRLNDFSIPVVDYQKGRDFNRDGAIPIEPWLLFLGIYLGDGSATVRPTVRQYITQIRSTDPDIRRLVMTLCADMGYNAFENGDAVRVTNKQLTLYLKDTFGGVREKRIPREILQAPRSQLRLLWEGLMLSDGYTMKNGQMGITLVNKGLVDDIQELALKLGLGASIRRIEGSGYNPEGVYWRLGTHRRTFHQYRETKLMDYDGYIYCADVPNGTLLVRRNGKPCWSCNSNAAEKGDPILQPGRHDRGSLADQIATLEDFVPLDFGTSPPTCPMVNGVERVMNWLASRLGSKHRVMAFQETLALNRVDAAIARPLSDDLVEKSILEIGVPRGAREATLGTKIKKSGRTTGLTTGEISQIDVTARVGYGEGRVAIFDDQLMAGAMSQGGDSGSVVLDEENFVVGLLFAGSDATTIMSPIHFVLDALGVEIAV